ncbi:hypothetical protein [Chlorobium ferrooxidans]|uniref:hypothetical protein n=1 Tax=Chlorobium ferrooxidans TaxID=84205 RepID=UPI001E532843|nr:hypothetical protein [Chlorobium ferrooxidans]
MNFIDIEVSAAGVIAGAAYGKIKLGVDYVLLKTVHTNSGFDASVFINSNEKKIWIGVAGTNKYSEDMLAWFNLLSDNSLNNQHYIDAIKFGDSLNKEIQANPLYSDYSIKVSGHSLGVFEAQILSYVFRWSGWGIDGPGAYGLIKTDGFGKALRDLHIIPE